jgi:hypothetical protein
LASEARGSELSVVTPRALCVFVAGCSFTASVPKPIGHGTCMPDRHPAQVDSAVVLTMAGLAIASLLADKLCTATSTPSDNECGAPFAAAVVSGVAAIAVVPPFFASATYGYVKDVCIDDEAVQMAREAITTARTGDCETTISYAPKIRELDTTVYDQLFVIDSGVAACLQRAAEAAAAEHAREQRTGACLAKRHEISQQANAISDLNERAKLLETMPTCE